MYQTPNANRLHIGIFGRTNSGKSSFINALTNQQVSIVADIAGTTTDPVYKAMEIHPLGACTVIDTAGFDDVTELGEKRLEKTKQAAEKTDLAVLVFAPENKGQDIKKVYRPELDWYAYFRKQNTPVLFVISKLDENQTAALALKEEIKKETGEDAVLVSTVTREGMEEAKEALIRKMPENYGERLITAGLVGKEDLVLLVMPQDIQAPKGG